MHFYVHSQNLKQNVTDAGLMSEFFISIHLGSDLQDGGNEWVRKIDDLSDCSEDKNSNA